MPLSTYDDVQKDSVAESVRKRFTKEISELRTLGFQEEFYLRETGFPFSIVVLSPLVLMMLFNGERVRVRGALQFSVCNPVMIHKEGHVYAAILKLGVVYRTAFDDGTVLSTATYDNGMKNNPEHRAIRQVALHAKSGWTMHTQRVNELEAGKRSAIGPLGMKDVVRLEMRNDRQMFGGIPEDLKQKKRKRA